MSHLNDGHLQLTRAGFNPTVDDVIEVRRVLTELGIGNHTVPMEIALMILSFASYQLCPHASVAGLYLTVATLSIPHTIARPKSITFQMKGADQGWATFGGNGTYENSHTWYEASILRPRSRTSTAVALINPDLGNFRNPGKARKPLRNQGWDMVRSNRTVFWRVHNNITACSEYRDYRVDRVAGIPTKIDDPRAMGDGQGFLELLRPDDIVVLWARAEEQAWVNKIREATIEIVYEVL
ncbi:hypothetical protein F4859DRAFT_514594 [Xylaria cf. heliscus]|nr:hypothetical protein F4859DRAFT_514594 [Xylaria cf. heliscus]